MSFWILSQKWNHWVKSRAISKILRYLHTAFHSSCIRSNSEKGFPFLHYFKLITDILASSFQLNSTSGPLSMQNIPLRCGDPFFIFLKIIFLFRDRGREGEREGEKHQCVVASRTPPTRDLSHNPGMCPDWESNQ